MRVLIAEDDFASRKYLFRLLSHYGDVDVATDGDEAVTVFEMAMEEGQSYDLICLDVMMPRMDGVSALRIIREIEGKAEISKEHRSKIIMTSAIHDINRIQEAFAAGSDGYAAKPIDQARLLHVLKKLGLKLTIRRLPDRKHGSV